MKTTELIIEVFAGGTLIIVALVFALWSYSPSQIQHFVKIYKDELIPSFGPIIAVVLAAWAYSMGIVAEYAGRVLSEWRLNEVKSTRLKEFLRTNKSILRQDPILQRFFNPDSVKGPVLPITDQQIEGITKKQATGIIGLMRFEIMRKNPDLSKEVESHVKRMRIMRILALVQVLFLLGLVRYLWPCSVLIWAVFVSLLLMLGITWQAIGDRFHRYCRAIERSYLVLILAGEHKAIC